jgi:hypothetical protein
LRGCFPQTIVDQPRLLPAKPLFGDLRCARAPPARPLLALVLRTLHQQGE